MMSSTYRLTPFSAESGRPPQHVSVLLSSGAKVHAVALREGQSLVVGRSLPAQLIFDDKSLSRTHARLSVLQGVVLLEDLGSTNGCFVAGLQTHHAELRESDCAMLGSVELRIAGPGAERSTDPQAISYQAFMPQLTRELVRARVFNRSCALVALRHDVDVARAQLMASLRAVDTLCAFAPTISLVLLAEQDGRAARNWWNGLVEKKSLGAGLVWYPEVCGTPELLISSALDAAHAAARGELLDSLGSRPVADDAPVVCSPVMVRLYELIGRAARTPMPVLIRGETGVGKELVARAVHEKSARAKQPFKALNCATIPTNLVESVLFGHERGAFTGADKQTPGIFEQAHGGTVFLDEVGELAPQAQAALLRALELRQIVRVGGSKEIEVDIRVIAATHRDLSAMVQAGTFREDLMFRLDALTLRVPPLRERREEILPLAELYLQRARSEWNASASRLSSEASETLLSYGWPGNVRQLKNVIERAVAVCAGDTIEIEDLPEQLWTEPTDAEPATLKDSPSSSGFKPLPARVRELEVTLIREALEKAHGNQAQAARILGVPRRTLTNKVHAYGILTLPP